MYFRRSQAVVTFLISSVLLLVSCSGDDETKKWTKTFGSAIADFAGEVKQTSDGGYIFTGTTNCTGGRNCDVYLAKIDEDGNIQWQRTFGGAGNDFGESVQETGDLGFIVVGTKFENRNNNIYLIKTDANGAVSWEKTYEGKREQDARMVRQTSDGGFIVVGSSDSFDSQVGNRDVYLMKTDARGELEWQKTFGGAAYDGGSSVLQIPGGGYVVVGRKGSFREGAENSGSVSDIYLIKTDEKGNTLWEKTFGGKGFSAGESLEQTSDGGYFITGGTNAFSEPDEFKTYIIKTDGEGNALWQKTYRGFENNEVFSNAILKTNVHPVIGRSGSGSAHKLFLMIIDEDGNPVWKRAYGLTATDGRSVQKTRDGGYIISGRTNLDEVNWFPSDNGSDFYIVKTDRLGNTQ